MSIHRFDHKVDRKVKTEAPRVQRVEVITGVEDMLSVWRADRCIQDNSTALYLQWIRRFRKYCEQHKLDERAELTLEGARRFIVWYAQQRLLDEGKLGAARNALRALSRVH
jgi:integrase/recombinase XerD